MADCPVCDEPAPRQQVGRPARFCSPACRAVFGQWEGLRRVVDELRTSARASSDPDEVRTLTSRAAELERGLAWQRHLARHGWAAANEQVDRLNAMVLAVSDDD